MSASTVDAALKQLLSSMTDTTELRDAEGNLLGFFTPRRKTEEELYAKARSLFDFVKAKRVAREERGQGRPLAEVLQRLQ